MKSVIVTIVRVSWKLEEGRRKAAWKLSAWLGWFAIDQQLIDQRHVNDDDDNDIYLHNGNFHIISAIIVMEKWWGVSSLGKWNHSIAEVDQKWTLH